MNGSDFEFKPHCTLFKACSHGARHNMRIWQVSKARKGSNCLKKIHREVWQEHKEIEFGEGIIIWNHNRYEIIMRLNHNQVTLITRCQRGISLIGAQPHDDQR